MKRTNLKAYAAWFLFLFALLALFAPKAHAQQPADPAVPYNWETTVGGVPSTVFVPNSSTRVATALVGYVRVYQVNFVNNTASSVTVTLTDGSTNCNGGACPLLPTGTALSIAAGTVYVINLNGQAAAGGVFWSASTANAVAGYIRGQREGRGGSPQI